MKEATYTLRDGTKLTVQYDPEAPCRICGQPVVEASVGGTDICPSCDCGYYRDGTSFTFKDLTTPGIIKAKATEIAARETP